MPVYESLANEIFTIELWHIVSLLLSVSVNYYLYLNAKKTPLLYTYLLSQGMLVIWMAAKICKTVSPNIELRWLFIVLQYFSVSFLGAFLLLFAYVYVKGRLPRKFFTILFLLPALYCFIIAATNPLHFRFYSRMTFYSDSFGDLFYINMIIAYLYLAISFIMLSRGFFKMFGNEKVRARLFAIAILTPFVINIFYVFRLFRLFFGHTPLFDYTPIATNVSLILFAFAALRYRFLDILPIAKRQLFEQLSDAVVVCSQDKRVIGFNKKAQLLFPGLVCHEAFEYHAGSIQLNGRFFRVCENCDGVYTVFRFNDITKIQTMLFEVEAKNKELIKTRTRLEQMLAEKQGRAAARADSHLLRELHDILGHAMVLSISYCEIDILRNAAQYPATLCSIKRLLRDSRRELGGAFLIESADLAQTTLILRLDAMIQSAEAVHFSVEKTVQGTPFEMDEKRTHAIIRLCQEALTNALKHSGASKLHVILRYSDSDLEVFIMDNGRGCTQIVNGSGLCGMEGRIAEIGGQIRFYSGEGEGFHIYAKVKRK